MRFSRHLIGSLAVAAILAPSLAHADDTATAAKWYDKLSLTGNVDTYYQVGLNTAAASDWQNGNGLGSQMDEIQFRAFDSRLNAFQYNADLNLAYASGSSSADVELIYGPKAAMIDAANSAFADNWNSIYDSVPGYVVAQAYVKQALGPVALTLGKFATPVGYETWNSTANANYSRSLLFQQKPFYSLGAKLDYAAPMGIGASLWMDNGNSIDYTISNAKNWGAGLSYNGISNLSLNAQWYTDLAEQFVSTNYTGSSQGYFDKVDYLDFNASYQALSSLSLSAEYLYKTIIDGASSRDTNYNYSPKAQGYAVYATYTTPVENLSVSGRFEQLYSPDAGIGTSGWNIYNYNYGGATSTVGLGLRLLDSYTLTVKYVMGSLSHILEYRADVSGGEKFFSTNGNNNNVDMSDMQQTLTYAAVYNF